jgi:hypothetical protein
MYEEVFVSGSIRKNKIRHRGVSVVECLILIIVLGVILAAVMTTTIWAKSLQAFVRADMRESILTSSWFEIFESLPAFDVEADNETLDASRQFVAERLGGNRDYIAGFRVKAYKSPIKGGVREIILTLDQLEQKDPAYVAKRFFSDASHATVSSPANVVP